MAAGFPPTSWLGAFLLDSFTRAIDPDLSGTPDAFKVALYTNSVNPSDTFNKNTDAGTPGAGLWTGAGIVVDYTGATPATHYSITTPTLTASGGVLKFYDADGSTGTRAQWTTATFTPRGCLVYDDTLGTDRGLIVVNFGADKQVVNGTCTVTWDATYGIAAITY